MKNIHFPPFLYRAFHGAGFRLSIALGSLFAICQVVQMYSPVDNGFSYPTSLYEMWLGGEWASYSSALLFLLLPLLATLPFSSALAEDRKTGYILQLLIRTNRYTVFWKYASTAFATGFITSITPFLENLLINAAIYPALKPQASTYTFSPSLRGFMVETFYNQPLLYCLLYVLLYGVLWGSFMKYLTSTAWRTPKKSTIPVLTDLGPHRPEVEKTQRAAPVNRTPSRGQ